jgi:DNA-binding response OmpR family regulator
MSDYISKISEAVGMLKESKKVLVVEDENAINECICYNLLKSGFVPMPVYDGREAIKKLGKEVFDIVILDLMLPGIDGFTVLRRIRANFRASRTAVVVVSAREQALDKLQALVLGADYYLTKPFKMVTLLSVLKELAASQEKPANMQAAQLFSTERGGESEFF